MQEKLKTEIINSFQFLLVLFAAIVAFIVSEIIYVSNNASEAGGDAGHLNLRAMVQTELYFFVRVFVWFAVFTLVRLAFIYFSSRSNFPRK